ncbi:ARMC9 [Mytilus edulis]|uniref:ARMC9 n=1 Tax=Mytilus edulis TaxID=6550 RepID=A0A8S3RWA1_MYTED|nr:ARMC9 [Mytilus edulis]
MSGSLSVVSFEGELNAIVQEYLEFVTFDKTLVSFQKECETKQKPITTQSIKSKSNQKLLAIQNELMQNFHKGKRDRFLKLWSENLAASVKDQDPVAKKLEFYVNIYFAVYPIKFARGQRDADRAMGDFKKYLETRGATLKLFTDTWVKDLELRLEKFLTLTLKSTPQPKLFDLYRGNKVGDENEQFQQISRLQQQLVDSERKTMSYIKRHNRVQADYHNLIGITADLVEALESTVQGKPKNYTLLVNNIVSTTDVTDYLIEEDIMQHEEREEVCASGLTTNKSNRRLLDKLLYKDRNGYHQLLKALRHAEYFQIANEVSNTAVTEFDQKLYRIGITKFRDRQDTKEEKFEDFQFIRSTMEKLERTQDDVIPKNIIERLLKDWDTGYVCNVSNNRNMNASIFLERFINNLNKLDYSMQEKLACTQDINNTDIALSGSCSMGTIDLFDDVDVDTYEEGANQKEYVTHSEEVNQLNIKYSVFEKQMKVANITFKSKVTTNGHSVF